MLELNKFDKWSRLEAQKEVNRECKKRKGDCEDCPFKEECHQEIDWLDTIEEW